MPLLAHAAAVRENSVVVAPDLGAVKLAREYAAPIIVDDILSTGATLEAAVTAVRAAGAADPVSAIVTHALLVGRAREALPKLGLDSIVAGDTVEVDPPENLSFRRVSVSWRERGQTPCRQFGRGSDPILASTSTRAAESSRPGPA